MSQGNKDEKTSWLLPIVVALIGLLGTLGAALIGILPDLKSDRTMSENASIKENPTNSVPSTTETVSTPVPNPTPETSASSQPEASSSIPEQNPETTPSSTSDPTLINLLGVWESQQVQNQWQMEVRWDPQENRYKGIIIKQGGGSEYVGFSNNELVWSATALNVGELAVKQKYRWGSNGISTGIEWVDGTVTLNQDTPDTFEMLLTPPATSAEITIIFERVQ